MDVLTVAIGILLVILGVGLALLIWRNGQLSARVEGLAQLMGHQAAAFRAALERQADQFTRDLGQVHREATLRIAAMRNEWVDVRQRWTLTAAALITAKSWIRELVATLRQHNIAVPVPPNVEEIPRGDESVYFTEMEAAGEYRLDDLIAEVTKENELNGTESPYGGP